MCHSNRPCPNTPPGKTGDITSHPRPDPWDDHWYIDGKKVMSPLLPGGVVGHGRFEWHIISTLSADSEDPRISLKGDDSMDDAFLHVAWCWDTFHATLILHFELVWIRSREGSNQGLVIQELDLLPQGHSNCWNSRRVTHIYIVYIPTKIRKWIVVAGSSPSGGSGNRPRCADFTHPPPDLF